MLLSVLLSAVTVSAAPASLALDSRETRAFQQVTTAWDAGAVTQYPIHASCNATQRAQIAAGLNETILLAAHAKDHVLRFGNTSELYQRYFGNLPPYEVIGAFDLVVSGDKANVLFRCDDPDGNCKQPDWHGHWRGSNATSETVICDLSYLNRRWLNSICGRGYTVSQSKSTVFWASDLLHRLYHVPSVGYGYIEHFIHSYSDAINFAKNGTTTNTHDSDVLQYFALDVYAHDVAVPGVGCAGSAPTSAAPSSVAVSSSATPTTARSVSQTSAAASVSLLLLRSELFAD